MARRTSSEQDHGASASTVAAPESTARRTGGSPAWARFGSGRPWLWGLGLVGAVLLAYEPVWRAGFVWDDSAILTANPCIVGPLGFRQIWTTHFADTCPLTLSVLWLEHALWSLAPTPYHVVNVLLHAAGALVLWRVLRGLQVPGAWLGAALWALHPVEVASVAWVAELKNTLSGLLFLGSIYFYLRWLERLDLNCRHGAASPCSALPATTRRRSAVATASYGACLLCTALAMASKSSTVVLPVVLGLCVWWREGRVRWRRIVSMAPLIFMGAVASVLTLWTQHLTALTLANDARWARPWPDRLVAGGEAVWFYVGKLLWPWPLMAIYPRWQVDAGRSLAWLPLLGVVAALVLLWRWRGSPWGRAGFFACAYFLTALLPVLGWFDGTDFRYSLVFDHFQYLASMGPLALVGAGAVRQAARTPPGKAWLPWALGAAVLLGLGTLSWQRSEVYRDEETFWTDAVAKNPQSWSGHGNLGSALLIKGQVEEARAHYEQALAINPRYAEAHNNLGIICLRQGKIDEAIAQVEQAVAIIPDYAEARSNLGNAFLAAGQVDQAIAEYEKALAINPDSSAAVPFNLGNALYAKGLIDEAIAQYEKALVINPDYAEAHSNLGNAFLAKRQPDEAIAQYEKALAINPGYVEAHDNLGIGFLRTARFDEAIVQFQTALRLAPDYPNVENNLATARMLARRAQFSQ